MKKAFVAGPYRADTHWEIDYHIHEARRVAAALWRMGWNVFCPHSNTAFFSGLCAEECFLAGALEFLEVCDVVVMVEGWIQSQGACAERARAVELGIPVAYWPSDAPQLERMAKGDAP